MKDNKKEIIYLLFLVLAFAILLGVGFYMLKTNEVDKNKKEAKKVEEIVETIDKSKYVTVTDLTEQLKDYYIKNNLVKLDSLEYWYITEAKYAGHFKDEVNQYYQVSFTWKCKNDSDDCVYVEQTDDNSNDEYKVTLYTILDENNKIIDICGEFPYDNFIEVDEKLELEENYIKKYFSVLKDKYKSLNLYNENNTEYWNIDSIEYTTTIDNEKYYQFIGSYKCKNNDSSCVYLEQVGDKNPDNSYKFLLFAVIKEENGVITIDKLQGSIPSNEEEIIETPVLTKNEKIFNALKKYLKEKNLYKENEIKYWNLESIEYEGTLNNEKYYDFESKFQCKKNNTDCLYHEQYDDINDDGSYDYDVYITYEEKNNEIIITSISSSLELNDVEDKELKLDKIKKAFIEYYKQKGLYKENQTKYMNVTVEFEKNINGKDYYEVDVHYACKTNTSTCVYQSQEDDANSDGSYDFDVYVTIKEENNKISILSIEPNL